MIQGHQVSSILHLRKALEVVILRRICASLGTALDLLCLREGRRIQQRTVYIAWDHRLLTREIGQANMVLARPFHLRSIYGLQDRESTMTFRLLLPHIVC